MTIRDQHPSDGRPVLTPTDLRLTERGSADERARRAHAQDSLRRRPGGCAHGWLAASRGTDKGQDVYLLRGLCVIVATIGFMMVISPFYGPDTSSTTSVALGVMSLLAGSGGFVFLGRYEK